MRLRAPLVHMDVFAYQYLAVNKTQRQLGQEGSQAYIDQPRIQATALNYFSYLNRFLGQIRVLAKFIPIMQIIPIKPALLYLKYSYKNYIEDNQHLVKMKSR